MPYQLEDGGGVYLAEDGSRLILESEYPGLAGTIAATSALRIKGRLAGTVAATSALTGGATVIHLVAGTVAGLSSVRAVNHSIAGPDYAADPDAIAAGVAPFRHVWVTLQVDLGRGLETIPNSKIGAGMTLTESLDQIADELQFVLVGLEFSPLRNHALAGRRRVILTLTYGGPGAPFSGIVFDGHLHSASFDGTALHCAAHDAAAQWVPRLISPDVAAGSGSYRTELVRQWLDAEGIPVGSVTLAGNGGAIAKPVSRADVPLFGFLQDFLSPADALIWCEQGRLHIASVAALVAQFEQAIGRNMIARPVSIAAAPTSGANTVTVAAVKYTPEATDAEGDLIPVVRSSVIETSSVYQPQTYDGSGPPAAMRVTSRVTTTTVTVGGVVVWQLIDEEGWYARHGGSRVALDSDGVYLRDGDPGAPGVWPGYLFPDGTLRADPEETFRLIQRTLTVRVLDVDNRVEREGTYVYRYRLPRKAVLRVVDSGGGVPEEVLYEPSAVPYGYVMLQDDGTRYDGPAAWSWVSLNDEPDAPMLHNYERAAFMDGFHFDQHDESTVTGYDLTAEGQITEETRTEAAHGRGIELTPNSIGAYVYGTSSREYWSLPEETREADTVVTTTTNEATAEDVFLQTVTRQATGETPVSVVSQESGALPYAQQATAGYESQEIAATVTNDLAVTLNGETIHTEQNEFCESVAELAAVAGAIVRDAAATIVAFDMPLEATIHKSRLVTPAMPEYGADVPALVWAVTRNLSTFRQTVTARVYQAGTV